MKRKILIVGGVAGGASAATRLRRHSEEDEIIIFEKGPNVSFSNCSLPYYLSGEVYPMDKLILMNPEKFMAQYKIDVRVNNEVIKIDRKNKKIKIKDILIGETYEEAYDKLILSPGAEPIAPSIPGIESINVFSVRNVVDIKKLNEFITLMPSKDITIIGGGFIGVEICENLIKAGFNVTLIEAGKQILTPFDYDMVQILHKEIYDKKVELILEDKVIKFENDTVVLQSGRKIKTNAVVMAIGVTPEIELAKESNLELGDTGAIKVDSNYRTNDNNIYAIGDAIEVYNSLTHEFTKLSLAGAAQKQARAVADHINGMSILNRGYIGSNIIKVFDYNAASTGLNENLIKKLKLNINYDIVRLILSDKVGIMPNSSPIHFKLLYEIPTGKILGAQAIGKGDVGKRIDIIATSIKYGATVQDLKDLELCYAPSFGTAKDIVNYAGYVSSNLLDDFFKQINVDKVRKLVEANEFIIDIRESREFELGHLKGAINLPLSELRYRFKEIPKDKTVYLYCRSGQRSYNATRVLINKGYNNIVNITGSFLGICFYEYFNDMILNRNPIVTEYNFK
ncbi:FAD-dependent oxidoreductase [Clostridium tarantellae]|uniref:Pyridine nucleotide-disulfide oxidoreductase n=1 Tax=Clostridium tarantellae TaxID=39493 RepID=A0A6I1MP72_9CLOT|nr:FAD-dependent oxidoreductase [Clostridium tarantellae]MPQ42671.1 pyridine nucleotide-disulfide oxidoreductase [Clostridium tarantellae]